VLPAVVAAGMAGVLPAAPAHAAPVRSDNVIVTYQDAGSGCATTNQTVVMVNPFTGVQTAALGKPTGMTGVLNEAKPFDRNNKIVAVWGGNSTGTGGLGVFTRTGATTGSWTSFAFPTSFERADADSGNNVHSVAALPDGSFAVAQVGTISGQSGSGFIVVFTADGNIKDYEPLSSAHGVEYDPIEGALYGIGYKTIQKYSYDSATKQLSFVKSYTLPPPSDPTKVAGGHDLSRRRTDSKYLVTTNSYTYVFDPKATDVSTQFVQVTTTGGATLNPGVKSIDEQFDGTTVYEYYHAGSRFWFLDGTSKAGPACMAPYKARWIWAPGAELHREHLAAAPTGTAGVAEPFLWQNQLVRADKATPDAVGSTIWAGYASTYDEGTVAQNIKNQLGNGNVNGGTGKVPYIMFYHWGDGNEPDEPGPDVPDMSEAETGSTEDYEHWYDFARTIAGAIGHDNRAYVVIESEWDVNGKTSACSTKFINGMNTVIDIFEDLAPNAVLVNSPGMWKSDSDYTCFTPAKRFDVQGFPLHVVHGSDDCTKKLNGSYYDGGYDTLQAAKDDVIPRIKRNVEKAKRLFSSTSKPFRTQITDLAITSCGWTTSGQGELFDIVVNALPSLYDNQALRAVKIRTDGPSDRDRAMGLKNEGGFVWGTSAQTAIARGDDVMKAHLDGISGPVTQPTFTASAEMTPHANPGQTVTISSLFTCTAGPAQDVVVDLELFGPSGTRVAQQSQSLQDFDAGTARGYPWTWTVPTTAASGTYTLKLGVFTTGWASNLYWNDNAATLVVDSTAEPSFTATASASPSSIGTNGTTTITATATNNGAALSNGVVTVEVFAPAGAREDVWTYTGQSIGAGASQSYSIPWTAPAGAGTYRIAVTVTGAGGTPSYGGSSAAGTITVSEAKFTSSVTTSTGGIAPGGTVSITTTVNNVSASPLTDGVVDLEIYDSSGARVTQQYWTAQSIAAGASASYPYTWTAPATPGTYKVKVGVFSSGWADTLHWNGSAASIGVAPPTFETGASATPTSVAPGGTTTITVTVTATGGSLANGVVDLEVYNAAGTRVVQKGWTGQNLAAGSTTSYSYAWTVPSTTGTYTVKVGVMGPGWTPTYEWNNAADSVVVTAPTFRSSATVAASTVTPGTSTTINATWTATGGAVTNARFQIAVDYPDGTRHVDDDWVVALADGASYTQAYTWTAPLTPSGTYKVRLGVFSNSWATTYHWNGTAATIGVGSATFQPTFRVGDGANNYWIEVYTSSDVTAVDVIGKDGAFYLPLLKKSWGAWAATAPSSVSTTDLVRFIARRGTDGATAGSNNFYWLAASPTTDPGWACTFTVGAGASTSRVEVLASPAATGVEVKVGNGAFTALTKEASGAWAKAMSVPVGSKVVFRATKSDGARAYSQIYNWLQ
jgi:hypothetical protein